MPLINLKTTTKISETQEAELTREFGKIITLIPGKTEAWLMLNFTDGCRMAFRGNNDADTAMVSVELLGGASKKSYDDMTHAICDTVNRVLGVPGGRIYVNYAEFSHWGYAGENF